MNESIRRMCAIALMATGLGIIGICIVVQAVHYDPAMTLGDWQAYRQGFIPWYVLSLALVLSGAWTNRWR